MLPAELQVLRACAEARSGDACAKLGSDRLRSENRVCMRDKTPLFQQNNKSNYVVGELCQKRMHIYPGVLGSLLWTSSKSEIN